MISFVNAKLNIGLYVTGRRQDGYHDLETLFYPVGVEEGTPSNPNGENPFCDILEITPLVSANKDLFSFEGRKIDCPPAKNLVFRAVTLFRETLAALRGATPKAVSLTLVKNLPDGAGLGGGSADASFTLRLLNEMEGRPFDEARLMKLALSLGADCPFFVRNKPAFATGVGDVLESMPDFLACWLAVVVKPDVYVSTKEAFLGMTPRSAAFNLRRLPSYHPSEWTELGVCNQFEETIFPLHPELKVIKDALYDVGASYASMSGSGAALYGLFPDESAARNAIESLPSTLGRVWLLKLV